MRMGKAPTSTSTPDEPGEDCDQNGGAVVRRQSVSFSPDVRERPDSTSSSTPNPPATQPKAKPKLKPSLMFARLSSARKNTDMLVQLTTRSKSCSNLPETRKQSSSSSSSSTANAPLLVLALASTSFLETTISESGQRLYVVDTKGVRTTICREDPVQGVTHVGTVLWTHEGADDVRERPAGLRSLATIQMAHGRRYYAEEFLRRTKLTSSRLFNIPHYPHTLKWKRSGGTYKLVVAKGKTTLAILEPAMLAAPPRIKILATLYEPDVTRPQLEHRGVPVFLLDYIIATALLVAAEKDEWLVAAAAAGAGAGASASGSEMSELSGGAVPYRLGGSIQRWRMEVLTEPFGEEEEVGVIDIGPGGSVRGEGEEEDNDTAYAASPLSRATRASRLSFESSSVYPSPGPSFVRSIAPSDGYLTFNGNTNGAPTLPPVLFHPFAFDDDEDQDQDQDEREVEDEGGDNSDSPATDDFGKMLMGAPSLTSVFPSALRLSTTTPSPSLLSSALEFGPEAEAEAEAEAESFLTPDSNSNSNMGPQPIPEPVPTHVPEPVSVPTSTPFPDPDPISDSSQDSNLDQHQHQQHQYQQYQYQQHQHPEHDHQHQHHEYEPHPNSNLQPTDLTRRHTHTRMRSASESLMGGLDTPRQASKSLPPTPTASAPRPVTAGAISMSGTGVGVGQVRRFRPLPRPPQVGIVGEGAPPVPRLPADLDLGMGGSGGGRGRGRGASVSDGRSVTAAGLLASPPPTSERFEVESAAPGPSRSLANGHANAVNAHLHLHLGAEDAARSIRRSASETTLVSIKPSAETHNAPTNTDTDTNIDTQPQPHIHHRPHTYSLNAFSPSTSAPDASLIKSIHRRSLYKAPFPAPTPHRTYSAPTAAPVPDPGDLPHTQAHAHPGLPTLSSIPRTAPLRIRQAAAPRQSTSSSVTAASVSGARSPTSDDDVDINADGDGEPGYAPPAYDSIDFSRPPLKQSGFRGIG